MCHKTCVWHCTWSSCIYAWTVEPILNLHFQYVVPLMLKTPGKDTWNSLF